MKSFILAGVTVALSLVATASFAQSPTKWFATNQSMADLTKDGWKIASHSFSYGIIPSAPGRQGEIMSRFSFILQKNEKYIICIVDDPNPPSAVSKCRELN